MIAVLMLMTTVMVLGKCPPTALEKRKQGLEVMRIIITAHAELLLLALLTRVTDLGALLVSSFGVYISR